MSIPKGKSKFRKGFQKKRHGKILFGGPPARTNPIGPDGQVMKRSICQSINHFRAKCPKAPAGGGKGKGGFGKGSSPGFKAHVTVPAVPEAPKTPLFTSKPSIAPAPSGQPLFFGTAEPPTGLPPSWEPTLTSRITFEDSSMQSLSLTPSVEQRYTFFGAKDYLQPDYGSSSIDFGINNKSTETPSLKIQFERDAGHQRASDLRSLGSAEYSDSSSFLRRSGPETSVEVIKRLDLGISDLIASGMPNRLRS